MAQDTAHATQHTEREHWSTGATRPRTPHTQNNTRSGHTGEQEPSGPGRRTREASPRAGAQVNRSQVAQDIAHTTQRTEQAHRCTGARWPRIPHAQHNTPSGHTGEQEPSGPGHRTGNTTHGAGTPVNRKPSGPGHRTRKATNQAGAPVNRSQLAQDSAHTTTHRAGAPGNKSQVAQDTAHATPHTERAHR